MKILAVLSVLAVLAFPVSAAKYVVDKEQSSISFSGEHAGNVFEGVFEAWDVEIIFDPDDLGNSILTTTFDAGSAVTGDKLYDGTLPKADWFDVDNHEQPRFESSSITVNDDGSYKARGDLTIRSISNPIVFNFTLSDLSVSPVTARGVIAIDRLAFDIGKKSDAMAEWVNQIIDVKVEIVASKSGSL